MKDLLLEIINCPNLKDSGDSNPCSKIISCQEIEPKQLPEPWNGEITEAPILFLSSNPSINTCEKFPTEEWDQEHIIDFFINRFSEESKWVKDELYPLLASGEYTKNWIRFWASIRKTASFLLQKKAVPGKDYAITEIVRCKSIAEKGVSKAKIECATRYLTRTLEISHAKLIICLGNKVIDVICPLFQINSDNRVSEINIGSITKTVLLLPHPNARMKRSIEQLLTPEKIEKIRTTLK